MAIKYYLLPNHITPDPNDQSARVSTNVTHNADGIISQMMRRGSTITEADIKAVLHVFFNVVADEVAGGASVNLPIANFRPSISGVFTSATDSFDQSRHLKRASVSGGILLNDRMLSASVEKIQQPLPSPMVIEFTDFASKTTNSKLTPGGIGQLVGDDLKFNPDAEAEGIFLLTPGLQLKIEIIATRTDRKLIFNLPQGLSSGSYTIEVRKAYGSGANPIRTGTLPELLVVS